MSVGDSPSDPVVRNLPSNAEDAGSIPGQGTKIPGAAELLSQSATIKTQFNQINKYLKKKKSLFSLPFPFWTPWKEVTVHSLHLKSKIYDSLLNAEYLQKLFGILHRDLSLLPHLLIY